MPIRGTIVFFQWKFRLLRAEILLNSKRAEEVVAQLDESVPPEPQFAPLAARKLMLQAQAASILGHADQSVALLAEARRAAEAAQCRRSAARISKTIQAPEP